MSKENSGFENSYPRFAEKVLDCVITVWETPSQIYDRYRQKNVDEGAFDNGAFRDIQTVLENLHAENEIMKVEDTKLGVRYCTLDSGAKNIVPFARKHLVSNK
jgi:hypothetical protein